MGKEYISKKKIGSIELDVIDFKKMPEKVFSDYKRSLTAATKNGMEREEKAAPRLGNAPQRAYHQYIKGSIKMLSMHIENDFLGKRALSDLTVRSLVSFIAFLVAGEKTFRSQDGKIKHLIETMDDDELINYLGSQASNEMKSPEFEKILTEKVLPDSDNLIKLIENPTQFLFDSKQISKVATEERPKEAEEQHQKEQPKEAEEQHQKEQPKEAEEQPQKEQPKEEKVSEAEPGRSEKPGTSRNDYGFYVIDWGKMTDEQRQKQTMDISSASDSGENKLLFDRLHVTLAGNIAFEPMYQNIKAGISQSKDLLNRSITNRGLLSVEAIQRLHKTMKRLAATEFLVNHPTSETEKLKDSKAVHEFVEKTANEIDDTTGLTAYFYENMISAPKEIVAFLSDPLEYLYNHNLVLGGRVVKKTEKKPKQVQEEEKTEIKNSLQQRNTKPENDIEISTAKSEKNTEISTAKSEKNTEISTAKPKTDIEINSSEKNPDTNVETHTSVRKQVPARKPFNTNDWRNKITACAIRLEKAQTIVNSKEYRDLISCMKTIGADNSNLPNHIQGKERLANELAAIYKATNDYLKHKAKDGVKKNVYGKLAVVEEANRLVEDCLKEMGDVSFTEPLTIYGKQINSIRDIPVSLDAQKTALTNEKGRDALIPTPCNEFLCGQRAREYCENKRGLNVTSDGIKETMLNVDKSMCRIMVHASMNNDLVSYKALESLRKYFSDEPLPELSQNQNKKAVNQDGLSL